MYVSIGKIPIYVGTTICNTGGLVLHSYTQNHMLTLVFNACDTSVRHVSHLFSVELSADLYRKTLKASNFVA